MAQCQDQCLLANGQQGVYSSYIQHSVWEGLFKRIHSLRNFVYLELEERSFHYGQTVVANSVSVYHFNDQEKLYHLDVYLQIPHPKTEELPNPAYEEILK